MKNFIDEAKIQELLAQKPCDDIAKVREIIAKASTKERLSLEETAILLNAKDKDIVAEILEGAHKLKKQIYGNRIVLFAPLYVGNDCINNCSYCGFRAANKEIVRKTLDMPELEAEIEALEMMGHKRLIMVYGEHPKYDAQFIHDTIKKAYSVKIGNGEIRRINVNAAPFDVEGFKKIKEAGIGTYQIFQETYHQETYKSVHPSGPKSDYMWRLSAFDRALEAGIDDVGMGALIGLYNHKFEALAMVMHSMHLEEKFNVGPHTISFPRVEPAIGTNFNPNEVSDDDFIQMIATLRLAVPYTGMILTCRENAEFRDKAIKYGVSQIDGGSNIGVGAYANNKDFEKKSQFVLNDERTLDDIISELLDAGYFPSFCTACYRLGRTGEHFMAHAKPGFIKRFCTPNAILTSLEYFLDYASPKTKEKGLKFIAELGDFDEPLKKKIEEMRNGKRDLFF